MSPTPDELARQTAAAIDAMMALRRMIVGKGFAPVPRHVVTETGER